MNAVVPAFEPRVARQIEKCGIVAVLVIDEAEDGVPLAECLLNAGVNVLELTLRTEVAVDALQAIKNAVPEVLVGAGTVLTASQVLQVSNAGADFAVSPGLNTKVLRAARELQLSFAPGIATPSDIESAVGHGCDVLKFFPAEQSGGLKYLKAITAPYAHLGLKFIPLGGLNTENMVSYISDPCVTALGGSWLAPRELIKAREWKKIGALAAEAVRIIKTTRKN